MALVDSLIVFLVSLLIGGFGLYVGGRVVADVDDYSHAILTAVIGAVVWLLASVFLGWIPLLGAIATLVAYVAVINIRYPGSWIDAILIALVAWVASVAVMTVLGFLGVTAPGAFGVPGV